MRLQSQPASKGLSSSAGLHWSPNKANEPRPVWPKQPAENKCWTRSGGEGACVPALRKCGQGRREANSGDRPASHLCSFWEAKGGEGGLESTCLPPVGHEIFGPSKQLEHTGFSSNLWWTKTSSSRGLQPVVHLTHWHCVLFWILWRAIPGPSITWRLMIIVRFHLW